MSAVSRRTSSAVAGRPKSTRSNEGIRAKTSQRADMKAAPSSGQGARPLSHSASTLTGKNSLTGTAKPKTSKKHHQTDTLRAKEDEYRLACTSIQSFDAVLIASFV